MSEPRRVVLFGEDRPLRLFSGAELAPVEVAYETYGELNAARSNAIVVCHALTGDARAAGPNGWWNTIIGPGRPLDTDRFFVISANLLGGCQGTTGPSSTDPATGRAYGLRFPLLHMRDLVAVHRALVAHLGIERLHAAIGGSLGGMQVLQWALDHPGEIERGVLICASARLTAMNTGFTAAARAAIMRDPDFRGGDYAAHGVEPRTGLIVARMMAHLTYMSEEALRRKFDRARRNGAGPGDLPMTFADDFEVEHYLTHQGEVFPQRFDALSYLYLTRVMDYFAPFEETDPAHPLDLSAVDTAFQLISFDTDWRFGTDHSLFMLEQLRAGGVRAEHEEISSPWGHDSFLLEVPAYHEAVARFLRAPAPASGVADPGPSAV